MIPLETEKSPWYRPDLAKLGTHFTCQACFSTYVLDDRSPDERYCLYCFDLLNDEYQQMVARGAKGKPSWAPRKTEKAPPKTRRNAMRRATIENLRLTKRFDGVIDGPPALSTVNGLSKKLPERKIKNMAKKGMGSKRIAAELIKKGINCNYRTIARVIKKKREKQGVLL